MSHNAFPGIGIVEGELFVSYRAGTQHTVTTGTNRGKLFRKTSADAGATWSTATLIFDDTVNQFDVRDTSVFVCADGTVLVFYFLHDGTPANVTSWVARSTDNGGTWSQIALTGDYTDWVAASGMAVQLPGGRVLAPLYGEDTGDVDQSARIVYSDDSGATWSALSQVADGPADSRSYQEPSLTHLASGGLGCMIRTDDTVFYWSTSTDAGATWSTPTTTGIAGSGRPGLLLTDNDTIIFIYRISTDDALIRQSVDDGATWSTAAPFNLVGSQYVYSQLVEISPGRVGVVHAAEVDPASAVYFDMLLSTLPQAASDSTGTVAVTLAAFTSTASGSYTPPPITGTVAVTLATFVAVASGTATGPGAIDGTVAVTLASFTSTASGTSTPPSFTGTVAVTLAVFTATATGTATPPPITGTAAVTLAAFVAAGSGTATGAGEIAGTVAVTLNPFTAAASGTRTLPSFTGTATPTLDPFLAIGTGTVTLPAITGTVAVTLGLFVALATATPIGGTATGTVVWRDGGTGTVAARDGRLATVGAAHTGTGTVTQ